LLGLFFDPEDGRDMFIRNVCWPSREYTPEDSALHNHRCENLKSYRKTLRSSKQDGKCIL
jgi:hypothetical protein